MSDMITKTIHESPLFKHLSDDDLNLVIEACTLQEVSAADKVIEEGSTVSSLFVLVEGKVKVSTQSVGKEVELKRLGPGAYFGEVSLLSGKTATATVEAIEDAKIIAIDRALVLSLVEEDEKIRKMLEGLTLKRAKDTLGKVLQ